MRWPDCNWNSSSTPSCTTVFFCTTVFGEYRFIPSGIYQAFQAAQCLWQRPAYKAPAYRIAGEDPGADRQRLAAHGHELGMVHTAEPRPRHQQVRGATD